MTPENPASTCLDDQTLAALAEGQGLASSEHHLARCERCRHALLALRRALDAPAGSEGGRTLEPLVAQVLAGVASPSEEPPPVTPPPPVSPLRSPDQGWRLRVAAGFCLVLGAWLAFRAYSPAAPDPKAPAPSPLARTELDGTWRPVGPPRPLPYGAGDAIVHVSTDKPVYRPGEPLYARGVVLRARDRRPRHDDGLHSHLDWELRDARGTVLWDGATPIDDAVGTVAVVLPRELPGGQYTLVAQGPYGTVAGERAIELRAYRARRLNTTLTFARDAYGPGDEVAATLEATRAAGGVPAGARVTAVATVDGREVHRDDALAIGDDGRCRVAFRLPRDLGGGDGTLSMVVTDGGARETAARTLPIVTTRLDLAFLPEGGELVAGLPCRVYVTARDPRRNEPADVTGRVVDDTGASVARFRTTHEGRGRFAFTPAPGRRYHAVLDAPSGVISRPALPEARADGVALTSERDAFPPGVPLELTLHATRDARLEVRVYRRDELLSEQDVDVIANTARPVELTAADADGVLRVTVFDAAGWPLAERLVYRQPARRLHVALTVAADAVEPRGAVTVDVATTDGSGRPVSAVVGLSAVDDSALELFQPRDRAPRLPAQVLLESEVATLRDPHRYLDDPERLDLLLGTQGWRRFAYVYPKAFLDAHADGPREAASIAALVHAPPPKVDMEAWLDKRYTYAWTGQEMWVGYGNNLSDPDIASGRLSSTWRLGYRGPDTTAYPRPEARHVEFGGWAPRTAEAMIVFQRYPSFRRANVRVLRQQTYVKDFDVQVAENAAIGIPADASDLRRRVTLDLRDATLEQALARLLPDGDAFTIDEHARGRLGDRRLTLAVRDLPARQALGTALSELGLTATLDAFGQLRITTPEYGPGPEMAVMVFREYAHQPAPPKGEAERTDFTETVYWHGGLRTDADGKARVRFRASDSITTLRVRADAFTDKGALGQADATVRVRRALYAEPKMPLEISSGDRVELPVGLHNGTDAALDVTLALTASEGLRVGDGATWQGQVAPGSIRRTVVLEPRPGFVGQATVTLRVTAGEHADTVTRTVDIASRGYPVERAFAGVLDRRATHELALPADVVPGTVRMEGRLLPAPTASLTEGVRALIREPHG